MRLYFDTNVYRYLSETGEARRLAGWARDSGHTVHASDSNLFETYAITRTDQRLQEVQTLTTVATVFEERPQSWYHSLEVRSEIQRCHREWLQAHASTRLIRTFLKHHTQHWTDARAGVLPDPSAYAAYRRDAEEGTHYQGKQQRTQRQARLNGDTQRLLINTNPATPAIVVNEADPEQMWRVNCLASWHNAVVTRLPASRDYADWLAPYLKARAFSDSAYGRFWMEEVVAENVPRNRVMGLAAHFQADRKIDHGNAVDQLHACHLLDVDLFFTADRNFRHVLECIHQHAPETASVVFLNRSVESALEQIATATQS